ncbi:hypothetical protein POJ06DRAFT_127316 [Lipomyces tetrasporus]|uniref:Uncharacterized protein n=1 Tax=Lipomyces tetrasporus TaxID=54092 RepID=A0AAD7QPV9_9ASCO|nr:uncharacterized protein POJ06DRAFT_127316 [Lipomyces tetrasporus]KAJ8099076.1 hypothetical protein POJ06DRAFT_127316 [Lipomyces tetrasporus]
MRRQSKFARIFGKNGSKDESHHEFTQSSFKDVATTRSTFRFGTLFKSKKPSKRDFLLEPTAEDTIPSAAEIPNHDLDGTIKDGDYGINASVAKTMKSRGPSKTLKRTLRTIFSKQNQKASRKEIPFDLPAKVIVDATDVQHRVVHHNGSIATDITTTTHEVAVQPVLDANAVPEDTLPVWSFTSCFLDQENAKLGRTKDSTYFKNAKGLHPISHQVGQLMGTLRSKDPPVASVVEINELHPANDSGYSADHQSASNLDEEEPNDQEQDSVKATGSQELSIETVSGKALRISEVTTTDQHYTFAAVEQPSLMASDSDDNVHNCIDDTLDAVNAFLRSDERVSEQAIYELDSAVEEVFPFNVSNNALRRNYRTMFDTSDAPEVTARDATSIFQIGTADSVFGLMATFMRYMLSESEDRRPVSPASSNSSSVASTYTNFFTRGFGGSCQNADVAGNYEPQVQNILKDSWDFISAYIPKDITRLIGSKTQRDQADHSVWQGLDHLGSGNLYGSVNYSPMKQIEPGVFTASDSTMIKGATSALLQPKLPGLKRLLK